MIFAFLLGFLYNYILSLFSIFWPLLHFCYIFLFLISSSNILLILTTVVSLEAIYLSIFIQMSVNRHSQELEEVSEGIEEIQEDVDEIQKDVDEIQEDVEEIQGEKEKPI